MKEVIATHKSDAHTFSKVTVESIRLIENEGVEGDAHRGRQVKHRYLVAKNPDQPNLRQVHLIPVEQINILKEQGFDVFPGAMGENITTQGIDLQNLPQQTQLIFSGGVELIASGARTPCSQLNGFQDGLTKALVERDDAGELAFKAGIFAVVRKGGEVKAGETIKVILPPLPHLKLENM